MKWSDRVAYGTRAQVPVAVVVASDVVYDESIMEPFIKSLASLAGPNTLCLLGFRNRCAASVRRPVPPLHAHPPTSLSSWEPFNCLWMTAKSGSFASPHSCTIGRGGSQANEIKNTAQPRPMSCLLGNMVTTTTAVVVNPSGDPKVLRDDQRGWVHDGNDQL